MDPASGALAATAALAAGAYLNAKLSIGTDLRRLRHDRTWTKRLIGRIQDLGDTCSTYGMFEKANPQAEFLWFEGRTWTYAEMKDEVNKLAAFLENEGVRRGDYVAVFMSNSPEMVITILALSKLGAIAALINISLRDDTLKHCLNVSTAQTMISTPNLAEFVHEPVQHYSLNLSSFPLESTAHTEGTAIISLADLPIPQAVKPAAKAHMEDLAVLVYTSGTTGKPKACAVRNHQMMVTSTPLTQDLDNVEKYFPLRTYSPLPLFHGTALFTALCYNIGSSSTICLSRKFSTSRFWKEVTESRATRILYVGELCRYLVHSPPSPYDRAHSCIVAAGNGLRGEIWDTFKERFNVQEVREFYRSTEGLAKFDNFNAGSIGAGKVGFAGPLRRYLETDTIIVLSDAATETPYRDPKTGFCIRAKLGEVGEAIGRVKSRSLLTEYLNNSKATEEKIMYDVFQKGDCYQSTGDLVMQDESGWVRFHDRMGDTFRWKGENVSAGEVREHLAKLPGVIDAVVYGMKLPMYDGQAGAAAITLDSSAEGPFISSLYAGLKKTGLPAYAMPRLVRITPEIEDNATFKKSKGDLIKKSWIAGDKSNGQDKLYWLNGTSYGPLDGESWLKIETGKAKL
ncbi:putative bifunctional fatty acid transporter/acyl-CoA synthetase [Amylocarpus encephaloides]|uniref:Bifunctional fatty acid transporter/acyl-CoA synthetase n=1 Tax=Amylocarpus encephaloides TaxID=45428 RepID=A0A9P8C891_9HELO|nr:putative bifunctional fatty acid transporter/acyl-CoA synthetase [Amylocarpus encephaloides]